MGVEKRLQLSLVEFVTKPHGSSRYGGLLRIVELLLQLVVSDAGTEENNGIIGYYYNVEMGCVGQGL